MFMHRRIWANLRFCHESGGQSVGLRRNTRRKPSLRRAYVCWSTARALLRSSVAITIFTRPDVV
jgi:hypothetical protein